MAKDELDYVRILEYNLIRQVSFLEILEVSFRDGVRQNLVL